MSRAGESITLPAIYPATLHLLYFFKIVIYDRCTTSVDGAMESGGDPGQRSVRRPGTVLTFVTPISTTLMKHPCFGDRLKHVSEFKQCTFEIFCRIQEPDRVHTSPGERKYSLSPYFTVLPVPHAPPLRCENNRTEKKSPLRTAPLAERFGDIATSTIRTASSDR